jgi:hypothetical protein
MLRRCLSVRPGYVFVYMLSVLGVPAIISVQFSLIRFCDWVSEVADYAAVQVPNCMVCHVFCYNKGLHLVETVASETSL